MKILKFLLKCILALLPILAVVIYTALVPYGYMDIEYPAWEYTKNIANDASKNYTYADGVLPNTLILGDSRAMADFVPSEFNHATINMAVGGATSIEMYYTLKNYIKNNGNPENVIIMIAPFHYTIIDNFWTRTAYFNYLSVNDISELYSYAKACGSETLLVKGYKNDLLSYRFRFPDKYLPALINSKLIRRYNDNKLEYAKVSSSFGYGEFGTEDGCSALNYETGYEEMHTTGDAVLLDVYLNKLLTLCEDNGINTLLTIPPMNESSYVELNPSYKDEFHNYMEGLKATHKEITVETEIPAYDDIYFGDASHLNHTGAINFTHDFLDSHMY